MIKIKNKCSKRKLIQVVFESMLGGWPVQSTSEADRETWWRTPLHFYGREPLAASSSARTFISRSRCCLLSIRKNKHSSQNKKYRLIGVKFKLTYLRESKN